MKPLGVWCLPNTNRAELERKVESWRKSLEDRGLKISRKKTEYLEFNGGGNGEVMLQEERLNKVKSYKYLGSTVTGFGDLDSEITHKTQEGWRNRNNASGVFCDRRITIRLSFIKFAPGGISENQEGVTCTISITIVG